MIIIEYKRLVNWIINTQSDKEYKLKTSNPSTPSIMQPSEQSILRDTKDVPHFSSFSRSSVDVKTRHLIDYLVNEIGIPRRAAVTMMDVHRCQTKEEVLQLLTIDENNHYGHVFVPISYSAEQCEVCGDSKQRHKIYDLNEPSQHDPVYSSFVFDQQFSQQRPQLGSRDIRGSQPAPNRRRSFRSLHMDMDVGEVQQPQHQAIAQALAQGSVLCQICYMNYQNVDIAKFLQQQHSICNQCMTAYVDQQITSMQIQSLFCPHCNVKLTDEIIKQFASPKTYVVYQKFVKNLQVQKNPNLMWCPNPKCAVVISIQKKKKVFSCPKCEFKICSKCKHEAHGVKSCQSVFEKEIKQWENSSSIQRCKKCSSIVEKISGCNHMSCSICGHEWCWLCGANYSERHFSPFNPFGCAGMQNRDDVGQCRIWFWRIAIFLLILIAFPVCLPLALIFSGPFVAIEYFYRMVQYNRSCFQKICAAVFGFILGLAFDPIIWIGLIIEFGPRFIRGVKEYFRSRRRRRENAENRLNQRLINDAIANSDNLVIDNR